MPVFKKLFDATYPTVPRILKRCFQNVRSVESDPATAGILQGLGLESLNALAGHELKSQLRPLGSGMKVGDILQDVKATDGLPLPPSHVEHLVGRATKGRIYQKHMLEQPVVTSNSFGGNLQNDLAVDIAKSQEKYESGGIDIAEKTQLILQSPHPVRYVIERELYSSQQGLHHRLPSYHTWIMLFGRSLIPTCPDENEQRDKLLDFIANASDAGMFSADIHNTIIDIPEDHLSYQSGSNQFHMGNKYSVLVGDYFAIRCIYFAERTKRNSVMVAVTEGVEEFTTSSFSTNLIDKSVGHPMMLSPNASVHDWIMYNQKAFGYLKGGLYAAFSLTHASRRPNQPPSFLDAQMSKFVLNFSILLRACQELESIQETDLVVPSPFLLISLPALLCQKENPELFTHLRKANFDLNPDHIREIHDIIRTNPLSMRRCRHLVQSFASETKNAFHKIAANAHYTRVFDSLIDSVVTEI